MLKYEHELGLLQDILDTGILESLSVKWRNAPDGEVYEFKIGRVDEEVLGKKETWAS
jgi:hypothetical protein